MKKQLPNILKAAGAVLGLVAFFMIFTNQVYAEILGKKGYVGFQDALFDKNYGATISFVGYLLILLASLGLCAMILMKDKKLAKFITLGLAFLLLLGAIFVFIEASVINGKDSNLYHLAAGPVFAGIFGILAALLGCASEFLPKK